MNISFTKLGIEQCEKCIKHNCHATHNTKCKSCNDHNQHLIDAVESRVAYRKDRDVLSNSTDYHVFSADMQKIYVLPDLPHIKEVTYLRSLVVYNEIFAVLGSATEDQQHIRRKKL